MSDTVTDYGSIYNAIRAENEQLRVRVAELERIVDANGTFVQEATDEVKRLEAELAKLRAETWQPVEDGYSIDDDKVQIQVQIGVGATWLAIRNSDVRFWPQLPDNVRLCKRGE